MQAIERGEEKAHDPREAREAAMRAEKEAAKKGKTG